VRSRRELRAADAASRAAEEQVQVARSGYWPSVGFVGNWYLAESGLSDREKATDWDALVALEFPFFEGGATLARERTAKSDVRKARLFQPDALRAVVQDVESALARAEADAELSPTSNATCRSRRRTRPPSREYSHGIATNLEVLTAQNVLRRRSSTSRQRLDGRLTAWARTAIGRTRSTMNDRVDRQFSCTRSGGAAAVGPRSRPARSRAVLA
jgi:outer membrane protein TolC